MASGVKAKLCWIRLDNVVFLLTCRFGAPSVVASSSCIFVPLRLLVMPYHAESMLPMLSKASPSGECKYE